MKKKLLIIAITTLIISIVLIFTINYLVNNLATYQPEKIKENLEIKSKLKLTESKTLYYWEYPAQDNWAIARLTITNNEDQLLYDDKSFLFSNNVSDLSWDSRKMDLHVTVRGYYCDSANIPDWLNLKVKVVE